MTRIVTTAYRYKHPPKKRKATPLPGPAIVRKPKPGNDNRPAILGNSPDTGRDVADGGTVTKRSAIVTARPKRRIGDGPHAPLELPLSRQPVEHDGDDYKRLKAAWHGGCAASDDATGPPTRHWRSYGTPCRSAPAEWRR